MLGCSEYSWLVSAAHLSHSWRPLPQSTIHINITKPHFQSTLALGMQQHLRSIPPLPAASSSSQPPSSASSSGTWALQELQAIGYQSHNKVALKFALLRQGKESAVQGCRQHWRLSVAQRCTRASLPVTHRAGVVPQASPRAEAAVLCCKGRSPVCMRNDRAIKDSVISSKKTQIRSSMCCLHSMVKPQSPAAEDGTSHARRVRFGCKKSCDSSHRISKELSHISLPQKSTFPRQATTCPADTLLQAAPAQQSPPKSQRDALLTHSESCRQVPKKPHCCPSPQSTAQTAHLSTAAQPQLVSIKTTSSSSSEDAEALNQQSCSETGFSTAS